MSRPVLFIVGMDDEHAPRLRSIGDRRGVDVEGLLPFSAVRKASSFDVDALLDRARERVAATEQVAGFTAYWDLPASCIAAILAAEHDLPTPGLEPVATVEHKYWSRLVQQRAAPEVTPGFDIVDLRHDDAADRVDVPLPAWVKPVKSYSSHLGRRVEDEQELADAVEGLRNRTGRLGEPMQQVIDRLDPPDRVAEVPATAAIAEELLDGHQVTLEGFVHGGEMTVHGMFDIHREANGTTFAAYGYPSTLPEDVTGRMGDAARRLMLALGWDDGPFNIEFFHDADTDELQLLEVNPRISQEHSHLMRWVDDTTNLDIMVDLALGRTPTAPRHDGDHAAAGKFFLRAYRDAVVVSMPDDDELAALEDRFAPCRVTPLVDEGDRLSEQPDQETYSYELAYVYLAGPSHEEIQDRYDELVDALGIQLRGVDDPDAPVRRVDAERAATLQPVP